MKIVRHTEGDSRTAKQIPTMEEFYKANESHVKDVIGLVNLFVEHLQERAEEHDWTKLAEPYRSMFYEDLCNTIRGRMKFMDGKWARLHYEELERHHLTQHCPDDVDLADVLEMICDCVAAGMARNGKLYDVYIPADILEKAVKNTVLWLGRRIELVEQEQHSPGEGADA